LVKDHLKDTRKEELYEPRIIFATPIYVKDVGSQEFNSRLEQNIINWSNQDKGLNRTNMNGWHSTDDMHTKPEYKELVDLLFQAQLHIYKDQNLDSEPFLGNMWGKTLILQVDIIDHTCILIHYGLEFIMLRHQRIVDI
jgi:hypothetical protein